ICRLITSLKLRPTGAPAPLPPPAEYGLMLKGCGPALEYRSSGARAPLEAGQPASTQVAAASNNAAIRRMSSRRSATMQAGSSWFRGARRPIGGSMPNRHGADASAARLAVHAPQTEATDHPDEDVMRVGLLGPLTLRRGSALITPSAPKLRQ